MATNSDLQAYIDSSNWLIQGMIAGAGIDSSTRPTSPAAEEAVFGGGRPMTEQRGLEFGRPQHEEALKCPRCESTHTKFCYYNNYSLSQPRYFCKTCRRYWTKGGTIRNIPVGGGCRKNSKKSAAASKKLYSPNFLHNPTASSSPSSCLILNPEDSSFSASFPFSIFSTDQANSADLHLTFPEQLQFCSSLNGGLFAPVENPPQFNFMEAKNGTSFTVAGDDFSDGGLIAEAAAKYHKNDDDDVLERLMIPVPYGGANVKPNGKILSHENYNQLQVQAYCSNSNASRETFGYNF